MYNYSDIKSVHLEVTSKCQAKCPMCPRRLQGGILNPFMKLEEITLDQFIDWFPISFVKQLVHLNMCGNLGDPIIAKDTLQIFQYLRSNNRDIGLSMHTNGSARSHNWWQSLAQEKVRVTFGIDGLSDTHKLYRIGTEYHKILHNAAEFIKAGGEAEWTMLIFKHNEHQVDECRELAASLGFTKFNSKNSNRFKNGQFNVLDDAGRTINILYPTSKSESMILKVKAAQEEVLPTINCKATEQSQIYIGATGSVAPCCWLDVEWLPPVSDSRIDYMDKILDIPNLHNQSLQEIFDSGYFSKISNCWDSTGLRECSKQCGSFDKLLEQFT